MKTTLLRLAIPAILLLSFPLGAIAATSQKALPHLDPEMTSQELQALLAQRGVRILSNDELDPILEAGKRVLEWVEFINQARPEGQKLAIQTAATQKGVPIDAPSESNRPIIMKKLADLEAELPAAMEDVLFKGAHYTQDPPVADEDFLNLARKVDSIYNAASRWLLQEPYLSQYAQQASNDVRGFYFLHKDPDILKKLAAWQQLDAATRAQYGDWLKQQCENATMFFSSCDSEFNSTVTQAGKAVQFFQKYETVARKKWNSFFTIPVSRRDVTWSSAHPEVMNVPFVKPDRQDVQDFLSSNIEDEWKIAGSWNLKLAFQANFSSSTPHVEFEEGATPHANALAGNIIVMDGNRPLTEYTTRWTIRHEFGHIIGFPDCYVEFYDQAKGVMINYQLDLDNLMCSRKGKFQQTHFDELKRVYFR